MRRRRLNWKGLLILSVAGSTLMAGVFFLHRFQVRNNSEALYDRAQSSLTDPALSRQSTPAA